MLHLRTPAPSKPVQAVREPVQATDAGQALGAGAAVSDMPQAPSGLEPEAAAGAYGAAAGTAVGAVGAVGGANRTAAAVTDVHVGPEIEVVWHALVAPADPQQSRLDLGSTLVRHTSVAGASFGGAVGVPDGRSPAGPMGGPQGGSGGSGGVGERRQHVGLGKQLLSATLGRVAGAGQALLAPLVGGGGRAGGGGGDGDGGLGGQHLTRLQLRVAVQGQQVRGRGRGPACVDALLMLSPCPACALLALCL